MSPLRNSIQSRCCCDVTDPLCYKLEECASSTGCAESGVFVSLLALQYLHDTYGLGNQAILCLNDKCCLVYNFFTQFEQYNLNDVLEYDPPAVVIYAKSEDQGGVSIEDVPECKEGCDSCDPTVRGACCYASGRGTACDLKTQEECKVLNGEYHGDDTCCKIFGNCSCPEENCKVCSDDVPDCDQYCGLCVEVDDGGNESFTWCSGSQNDNIGCADQVQMTLNFPSMPWVSKIGTTNDCGDPDCGQGSLDNCCTAGNGTVMGGSMTLEKVSHENKWQNIDDQQSQPLEERPDPANQTPLEKYTYLGSLDGQYRFGGCSGHNCPESKCDTSGYCSKCRPEVGSYPEECVGCSEQEDWDCPCCCGSRWMSCWGQAEVWQDTNGQCPDPTEDHGSVCWQVRISVTLMHTGCLDPYGGDGCNCATVRLGECLPDTQNFPDSTRHIWSRSTSLSLYYKIQVPECGCPNGISSGDAWEVTTSGGIPEEKCMGTCHCKRWANWFGGIVDYNTLVGGTTWSIA